MKIINQILELHNDSVNSGLNVKLRLEMEKSFSSSLEYLDPNTGLTTEGDVEHIDILSQTRRT